MNNKKNAVKQSCEFEGGYITYDPNNLTQKYFSNDYKKNISKNS